MAETIHNRGTGDNMTFLQTASETNGRMTEFIITLSPRSSWAKWPKHYHSHQTETFKVLSGELNLCVGKDHFILKSGDEKKVVPPFTYHRFWNDTDAEVELQAEIFPPRNIEKALRMTYKLSEQGKINSKNLPKNPMYTLLLMGYFDSYIPIIPWKIQRFIFKMGSSLARSFGFNDAKVFDYEN